MLLETQRNTPTNASIFNSYFQRALSIVEIETEFAARLQRLHSRLSQQQESILDQIKEWPVLESLFENDNEKDEFLFTCYQSALNALQDVSVDQTNSHAGGEQPRWITIYQLLSTHFSHEQIIELVDRFIQATNLDLTDSQLLICSTYLEQVILDADATLQLHRLGTLSATISNEVFDAIRVKQTTDQSQMAQESLNKLEEDFAALLQQWANTKGSRIACEVEFIYLFLVRLIAHYPNSHRFWIYVLFKLDTILASQTLNSTQHVLSDSIEILINSVDRFEFLSDCIERISPFYEDIEAPIGELLIVLMLLQPQSHVPLYSRFLHAINCRTLLDNTDLLPDELQQIHRRALDILRPGWERVHLDWLSEACENVDRLLAYTDLTGQLLKVSEHQLRHLGTIITRKQTDAESAPLATSLLTALLREACYSTAVTQHPQRAEDLYRFRVALILDTDIQASILKRTHDIAFGLQHLKVPMQELQILMEAIQPLLASLENLIQENLIFTNGWLSSTRWIDLVLDISAGEHYFNIMFMTSLVAMYRRLYNPAVARLELTARYKQTLLRQSNTNNINNIVSELSVFQDYLRDPEPESNQELVGTLRTFWHDLTLATAAINLQSRADIIATSATREVMSQHPEYAKRIGKRGIKLFARNNKLLLLRIAHIMAGTYRNGQNALMGWWDAIIGAYLINRDKAVLQANLKSLQASLMSHLNARETQRIFDLVQGVYLEAMGISLERDAVPGNEPQTFSNLPLDGACWKRVFSESRPTMAYIAILQDNLKKDGSLVGLNSALVPQLQTFTQAFAHCGEEEAAWQQVQPLFNAALEQSDAETLEMQWRSLLCHLPHALSEMQSAYWIEVLDRGLELLRQVGLGRKLEQNASELGQRIAAQLMLVTDASAEHEQQCQRDITLFLQHLAAVLRTQPPSLAVLNAGRYLVQCIAPFVDYSEHSWHMVWLQLQESLAPLLDRSEKLSLFRWIAILDGLSNHLDSTRTLGQMIFHSQEFLFAETQALEYAWRDTIGGLIVAALSGDRASLPGEALVQRLILSSAVFQAETAASWEARQATLTDAFHGLLSDKMERLIRARHKQIISTLINLMHIEEHNELTNVEAALVLLKGLPYAQVSWQNYLCMRVADESAQSIKPSACELQVSQLTNWSFPSNSDFANAKKLYLSLCQLQDPIELKKHGKLLFGGATSFTLPQSQHEELKLLLRRLVLLATLQNDQITTTNIRAELFEMLWLGFTAYNSEQQHIILSVFLKSLQQLSNLESLESYMQLLMMYVVHTTLARRALDDAEALARACVKHSRTYQKIKDPAIRSAGMEECLDDISLLIRHIGLQLSGLQPDSDLAQWYWQHIGIFLSPPNRKIAMSLLPTMPNTSRHLLTRNERELLATDVADLCKVFARPDWETGEAR